ncbi:unnamed protein product [Effrenium voratum]|nr:unnamed protein product [Effrenium voratum]
MSLDRVLDFVDYVRERNGFTVSEREEFLKPFAHFCDDSGELPTLQVKELLEWMGFKNRVEEVRKMVQQVDFNENGTMDRSEYLRLMRLQKEVKLSVYQRVYQQLQLGKAALTQRLLGKALQDAGLDVVQRLVEESFKKCQEDGDCSAGISWDTWVYAAEHTRKMIPVEKRKQATFSDAELEQLRCAFSVQSSHGYVSKGQLLWMLSDSGMPVNKASGRRELYLNLDRARRQALEAGVPAERWVVPAALTSASSRWCTWRDPS